MQNAAPTVAIVRPASETLAAGTMMAVIAAPTPAEATTDVWASAAVGELAPRSAPSADSSAAGSIAQRVVQKFADFRRYVATQ